RCALDKAFHVAKRFAKKPHHRQHADLLNARLLRQEVKKVRRKAKLDPASAADLHHHIKQPAAFDIGIGNDDLLGTKFTDDIRKPIDIADDAEPGFVLPAGPDDS